MSIFTTSTIGTLAVTLLCASVSLGATFLTVGVYDENSSEANTVDTDITGTLASFTSDVSTAFSNNRGGVIDFQTGFTNGGQVSNIGTSFTAGYGTGKELAFSSTAIQLIYHDDTASQVDTISDNNNLLPDTNITTFTLGLGAITGGDINEAVTEIGLTILSRSVWGTSPSVSVTANFSGGGSANLSSSITNVIGADDTFYHFVAPTGQSITSLDFDNSTGGGNANQNRIPVDDLAFITAVIPEPSSLALICLGVVFGLVHRRRV